MPSGAGAPDKDQTTTDLPEGDRGGSELAKALATVLVIAWCREEPARVGELAIVPSGAKVILGRGASDTERRMLFFRPRPGRLEPTAPLSSRALSRRQVEIELGNDGLEVRNVGRRALSIDGTACGRGMLNPGSTLMIEPELVLFCTQRPVCPPPLRHWESSGNPAFGIADASGIVGESPAIWRLRDELAFAARSGEHVLLVGETGTGKELAARAVHRMSPRAASPLVARNAATLPSSLIDAEVFGNAKNYPNPGMAERLGLIGQADQGYLFLDELGELPLELQAHLLRVLDCGGEYQRLGESISRRSNFRLLAATNRDPDQLRRDLVARMTVRIQLPALAGRREDIPLLMRHLVVRAAKGSPDLARPFINTEDEARPHVRFAPRLVEALLRRDYPGNTRELHALLWKAMGSSSGDTITLPEGLLERQRLELPLPSAVDSMPPATSTENLSASERHRILQALAECGGNQSRAAEQLGMSRRTLVRQIARLHLPRPRRQSD